LTQIVPTGLAGPEYKLSDADFQTIAQTLRQETGIFLADSKKQLVYSRLSKRLRALKLGGFSDYCQILESEDAGERAKRGDSVRLWSAGCSGGQEPYTIAMEVLEWLPDAASLDVKVLATDIDPNMVEKGQKGIYTSDDVQGIEQSLRQKYFQPVASGDQWRVKEAMRELVTFRELNLFKRWPMRRKFDVIFCRNVVIYFEIEDQVQLWQKFVSNMMPEGWLFIGHSERLSGPAADKFLTCGVTAHKLKNKN